MNRMRRMCGIVLVGSLCLATPRAEDKEKVKYLAPTYKGSTGFFSLATADTLRQGEFSLGYHSLHLNREPGDLDITLIPTSFTLGLHDRVEFFLSFEVQRRVHADAIRHNNIVPGQTGNLPPSRLPNGLVSFFNDTPFLDVGFGAGPGDLWTGVKFNFASERYGNPIGIALQPMVRVNLDDSPNHLGKGLSSGGNDVGFDLIVSKNLPGGGTFAVNSGLMFAEDVKGVNRQHAWNYGLGLNLPLGSLKANFIGELVGSTFFGERTGRANPKNPLDLYAGLRVFPVRWLAVGGGYLGYMGRTIDRSLYGIAPTERHGWFTTVNFQRKVNRPPTIECTAEQSTVIEGDNATIRATVVDSDDDVLTITWRTTAGRISQQESSAIFQSSGLAPGSYTVSAEVSDGQSTAVCSADIRVEKRKMPPTIVCEPSSVSVVEGQSTTLRARASDPNNDPLTYSWTVDGQSIPNNRPEFDFGSVGRSVGAHSVNVRVSDVDGMSAECSFQVTIERRPNTCPSVNLRLDKDVVYAGETINASAEARDAENDPITLAWKVDNQDRSERGASLLIDTSGMAGGRHTVTVTATDDRNCPTSATQSFSVREKVIIQMPLDNIGKAQLDEIALKMQQNPALRATLTGHTDDRGSEEVNQRVGLRRAQSVQRYLVEQHQISETRLEVRSAGESSPIADNATEEGRKRNRRVEVELFVP